MGGGNSINSRCKKRLNTAFRQAKTNKWKQMEICASEEN